MSVGTLITLVGGQPIPSLLPIRALQPERVLFVHTGTGSRGTEPVACRIARLTSSAQCDFVAVKPYDLQVIRSRIADRLLDEEPAIFNLTSGTKIMTLAAYGLAAERGAPFVYLRTEGRRGRDLQSVLYRYAFREGGPVSETSVTLSGDLLSLDAYLKAHWDHGYTENGFSQAAGGAFEEAVYRALDGWVDEIKAGVRPNGFKDQVEIDLVIRCGNQVGIIEVKRSGRGESGKKGVDQLTTAAARELSGIYTARFLITGGSNREEYKQAARKLGIRVVDLFGARGGQLSQDAITKLQQAIAEQMPVKQK